jgi:proteic killer suppression protein
VEIKFTDKRLEKIANDDRKMLKELGKIRATILRRRLTQLEDANTLEDVRYLSGNYHELAQNRKGQWGCDLDQPYRLVFTAIENPIPLNDDGQYVWLEISGVEIIEIINYHKEK